MYNPLPRVVPLVGPEVARSSGYKIVSRIALLGRAQHYGDDSRSAHESPRVDPPEPGVIVCKEGQDGSI